MKPFKIFTSMKFDLCINHPSIVGAVGYCKANLGSVSRSRTLRCCINFIFGRFSFCCGSKQLKQQKWTNLHCNPFSHLCLFEVIRDFLHEGSIVSPLHSELFVFKVEGAAAWLAFPLHGAVCEAGVYMSLLLTDCSKYNIYYITKSPHKCVGNNK